jgi:hypothetical protein
MRHLADLMGSLPWWQLRPAPALLLEQPGRTDARRFVTAARSEDGAVAVIYVPEQMRVHLDPTALRQPVHATWFDPETGARQALAAVVPQGDWQIETPGSGDRVLVLLSEGV